MSNNNYKHPAFWLYKCNGILLKDKDEPLATVVRLYRTTVNDIFSHGVYPNMELAVAADILVVCSERGTWRKFLYGLNCLIVDTINDIDDNINYTSFDRNYINPMCERLQEGVHEILFSTNYVWERQHRLKRMDIDFLFSSFHILEYVIRNNVTLRSGAMYQALKYMASIERIAFSSLLVKMIDSFETMNPVPSVMAMLNRFDTEYVALLIQEIYPSMIDGTSVMHEIATNSTKAYVQLQKHCIQWRYITNSEGLLPAHCALLKSACIKGTDNINIVYELLRFDIIMFTKRC